MSQETPATRFWLGAYTVGAVSASIVLVPVVLMLLAGLWVVAFQTWGELMGSCVRP